MSRYMNVEVINDVINMIEVLLEDNLRIYALYVYIVKDILHL